VKAIKRLIGRGGGSEEVRGSVGVTRQNRSVLSRRAAGTPLRVILFIGHHKVGSTSLQDYLARNAAALSQAGILYPYVDFEAAAYMAAAAAGHPLPGGSLPINIREPHNALAFRMLAEHKNGAVPGYHKRLPALPQMLHAIRQQVQYSEPHTVILAAEVFANFNATAPQLITQLRNQFEGAEFTVVATLRRIDEYLASWHGQRLKFGHKLAPLRGEGVPLYTKGIHFDYRLMIEGWINAMPEAQIILRDYAEVRAAGGSVVDFISQTGLKLPAGLAPERRENDSFHRGVYELARRGNHAMVDRKAGLLRQQLRKLTPKLELPPSHDIELFGRDVRAQLIERFRPVDQYLGEVMGRAGFFQDLDAALEPLEWDEMEVYAQLLSKLKTLPAFEDDTVAKFVARLQAE
jgi:hypothetical protein